MRSEAESETWISGIESSLAGDAAPGRAMPPKIGAGGAASTRSAGSGAEPQEDLAVAARPLEARRRLSRDGVAERLRGLAHRAHGLGPKPLVVHHPALPDPLAPHLEVRLHEREHVGPGRDLAQPRQDEAERDER